MSLSSSWEERDGANTTGKIPTAKIDDAGIAVQTHLNERAESNVRAIKRDFKFAKTVQEKENDPTIELKEDMDLARKLQDEEENLADPQTVERDFALAEKLQNEEEKQAGDYIDNENDSTDSGGGCLCC